MSSTQKLHRLKEARECAGLSLRSISRRTGLGLRVLRKQEESNDISLHDLTLWRDALGVPMSELFGDPPDDVSDVRRLRAGLLHIMRSIQSLLQTDLSEAQSAFVRNIETKLQTLMPEVKEARAWPIYGDRRGVSSQPQIEAQVVATSVWFPDFREA